MCRPLLGFDLFLTPKRGYTEPAFPTPSRRTPSPLAMALGTIGDRPCPQPFTGRAARLNSRTCGFRPRRKLESRSICAPGSMFEKNGCGMSQQDEKAHPAVRHVA